MVELFRSPRKLLLFCYEGTLVAITVLVAACLRLGVHDGLTMPHVAKKIAALRARSRRRLLLRGSLRSRGDASRPGRPRSRPARGPPGGRSCSSSRSTSCRRSRSGGASSSWRSLSRRSSSLRGAWSTTRSRRAQASCGARSSSGAAHLRASSPGPRARGRISGLQLVGMLARDRSQVDPAAGVIGTYRDLGACRRDRADRVRTRRVPRPARHAAGRAAPRGEVPRASRWPKESRSTSARPGRSSCASSSRHTSSSPRDSPRGRPRVASSACSTSCSARWDFCSPRRS